MEYIDTIEVDGVVYRIYNEGESGSMVVIAGSGASSLMQRSLPLPGESAGFRENIVTGNFSGAFGSRVVISGSESFGAGGIINIQGENAFAAGYRVTVGANQAGAGGYRCTNRASESFQWGNNLLISGVITEEEGHYESDSRYNAQFGQSSTMGHGSLNCFMSGEEITQGDWCKWLKVVGKGHNIGDYNRCVNVAGYENTTTAYLSDSTIEGSNSTAYGGSSDNDRRRYVYIRGYGNTNRDANGVAHSNVYLSGIGLRPKEDDQFIVGAYNAGVSNCWFEVGCGSGSSARNTAFAVCQQGNNRWIKIGGTTLSEAQLQSLLALIA